MSLKIYVINMDESPERLNHCADELSKHGVTFERIQAVDVRKNELLKNKHYSEEKNKWSYYKSLTDGEIGCYLSHRKAWAKIIEDNVDFGLVLEDDFDVAGDIKSLLSCVSEIKSKWHCIKLAEFPIRRKATSIKQLGQFNLVSYNKPPIRACAQIISKEGAELLLRLTEKIYRPVDVDIQWFVFDGLIVNGITPYTFEPSNKIESDIDKLGKRKFIKRRMLVKILNNFQYLIKSKLN